MIAPETRGYVPLYRAPQICPGCTGQHWFEGRQSAECARCGTALPFAPIAPSAASPEFVVEGISSCQKEKRGHVLALLIQFGRF
jgi:hypothetical protein